MKTKLQKIVEPDWERVFSAPGMIDMFMKDFGYEGLLEMGFSEEFIKSKLHKAPRNNFRRKINKISRG